MKTKLQYIIFAVLIFLLFPYFAIYNYIYPQGDDFFLLMMSEKLGVIGMVSEMYLNWSGRYFAILLGSINPSSNILILRASLALFQLVFICSIFLLIKSLLKKSLSNIYIVNISLSSFLVFVNVSPFLFEFHYWYPSVTAYQFSLSLLIMLWAVYFFKEQKRLNEIIYRVISVALILAIIGLNELMIAPLFVSIVIQYYKEFKLGKNKQFLVLLIVIFSVAFAANVFSVGNYVRLPKLDNEFNIINIIWVSIKSIVFVFTSFIQNASFIFSTIFLVFISGKFINKEILSFKILKIHPLKYGLISLITLFVFILPGTIILGHIPPGRALNLFSFFFFVFWIYGIFIFVNYYPALRNFISPKYFTLLFSFLIFFFMLNSIFVFDRFEFGFGKKSKAIYLYGNELAAWNVFLFEAQKYKSEIDNRHKLYQEAKEQNRKTIAVPPLIISPKLLIFETFYNSQKKGEWYKDSETQYYNLDSIYIETR